jgi:hypothetical protein
MKSIITRAEMLDRLAHPTTAVQVMSRRSLLRSTLATAAFAMTAPALARAAGGRFPVQLSDA